jgi:hypothetical protein
MDKKALLVKPPFMKIKYIDLIVYTSLEFNDQTDVSKPENYQIKHAK